MNENEILQIFRVTPNKIHFCFLIRHYYCYLLFLFPIFCFLLYWQTIYSFFFLNESTIVTNNWNLQSFFSSKIIPCLIFLQQFFLLTLFFIVSNPAILFRNIINNSSRDQNYVTTTNIELWITIITEYRITLVFATREIVRFSIFCSPICCLIDTPNWKPRHVATTKMIPSIFTSICMLHRARCNRRFVWTFGHSIPWLLVYGNKRCS